MSLLPDDVNGTDKVSQWLRKLRAYVRSLQIINSPTVRASRGPNGTSLEFIGGSSATPTPATSHQQFFLRHVAPSVTENFSSIQSEYLICYRAGDVNQAPVNIAKPFKLRCSITAAVIDGEAWTYAYPYTGADQFARRDATVVRGGATLVEKQLLTPRLLTGDELWAWSAPQGIMKPDGTLLRDLAGNLIVWSTEASGRNWSAKSNQNS